MKKTWVIILFIISTVVLFGFIHYHQQGKKPVRQFEPTSLFHPSNFKELRFAHRGGYAFGPENTLETVLHNIRNNEVIAIEVDVMMSKDGKLYLFHDDYVNRVLNYPEKRLFSDFTSTELSSLTLRDTTFGRIELTSLAQLVDSLKTLAFDESYSFLVELDFKPSGDQTEEAADALMAIVKAQEQEIGPMIYDFFFVSTFFPEMLSELRSRSDHIVTAFGVHSDSPKSKWAARAALLGAHYIIKKNGASIIEPNLCLVTPSFVDKWQKRDISINTYTVNTFCEKEYMNTLPVAYTTNCPNETCLTDEAEGLGPPRNWCTMCSK